VLEARSKGKGWSQRVSHTLGRPFWYAALLLKPPAPPGTILRIAVPESILKPQRDAQSFVLLFGLAIALISAAVLAWGAARLLSARLGRVVEAAERLGEGDLDARAPEQPEDEIGRTGHALNQMGTRLAQRLAEVRREHDQRELILTQMADGVALVDSEDRLVQANPGLARILGLTRQPASGRLFDEEIRQPALSELLSRAREEGAVVSEELTLFTPAQTVVEATVASLGPPGAASRLLVVHDLSRVKQLERVRQEFVANVSHELKTPLTLIRGSAETLLDGGLEDARHRRDFVEKIDRHALRLQQIVDDLLQLAKLEQPAVKAERREINLAIVARNVAATYEVAATRKGLALRLELPESGAIALADPELLERALSNLLDNAVKYTPAGEVKLAVGLGERCAYCEVSDTGPGIPPESLPRIFERFYRVDLGRSRELGGTGLGLSIVRHSVELMGGTVQVRSELGSGTTFRIELEIPTEG
jgi:two-component system phosphate regulon sensor histidine kinase PhoR